MKQILTFLICCIMCSCSNTTEICKVDIVNCYTNELGRKIFVMSDGGMAEIIAEPACSRSVQFYDHDFNLLHRCHYHYLIGNSPLCEKWMNAEVGGRAVLKVKKVAFENIYYYEVLIEPNTTIERKIARITKYDGNLNKIEGSLRISGGFLTGSSGSGKIKGIGAGVEKMFINIYFDDRDPITVNAMENQLWLDVEEGDTVIERRINGKTSFFPKF
mgnify:CR=1 FL=1